MLDNTKNRDENIQEIDQMFNMLIKASKTIIIDESIKGKISFSQFTALACLSQCGAIKMSDLTGFLTSTHGATTGLIDRLIKMELVQRQRSEKDRRVVYVSITQQGKDLIDTIRETRYKIFEKLLAKLALEERMLLYKTLNMLKENLLHE